MEQSVMLVGWVIGPQIRRLTVCPRTAAQTIIIQSACAGVDDLLVGFRVLGNTGTASVQRLCVHATALC